jgi:hypothetical protein
MQSLWLTSQNQEQDFLEMHFYVSADSRDGTSEILPSLDIKGMKYSAHFPAK